ncbi:MAG: DNA-3-methyladenine glycosylase I, partial [Bacteroidales bacterium]|nr:DNA-3-methyladenine glycosylase I [Bacteroidales bacterium]
SFLQIQAEFGSFDAYLWAFVGGQPKQNQWRSLTELPAKTAESEVAEYISKM